MKQKAIALAVAGILGTPMAASAQSSSLSIYGRLYPELTASRTTGATAPGTPVATMAGAPDGENRNTILDVEASNSRLGLRGEERLGNGLKAIFQIEMTIPVDTGGGQLATRDTFVGLQSETWGTVQLGFMDTVYKQVGDTLGFLGISSGNFVALSNVLAKSNLGDGSAGSFHLRRANSVIYTSPEVRDFKALVGYSPDERKGSARNVDLLSVGAIYETEQLYLGVAYERHNDTFGGSRLAKSSISNSSDFNASSEDESVRLTAQYKFGIHRVEGNVARLKYKETGGRTGRFGSYESDHYSISLDTRWSPQWRTAVSYAGATDGKCSLLDGAACNTDGLDGQMIAVGGAYNFSRRTAVFALYARLQNGKSASFNNLAVADVSTGAEIDQYAIGILHNF